jgi:hypothetical protein
MMDDSPSGTAGSEPVCAGSVVGTCELTRVLAVIQSENHRICHVAR